MCFACLRTLSLVSLSGMVGMVFAGCVSVDPRPDYQNTSRMVIERTGTDEVYEPGIEPLIEGKISGLLEGGLTTREAVQVALLNNRSLQAAFQQIGVSRAEVVQSGLLSNPSLGFSLRFPEGGGRSNLTLTFAQQLVDLWQIPVRKRIAEAELERTILGVGRQAVALAAEVETCCHRLLAVQKAELLAGEDMELAQRLLSLAQGRFNAGEAGKLDVNLARVAVLDVQQRSIALRGETQAARSDLARLLGLARWDGPWSLVGDFPDCLPALAEEAALLDWAMHQRLDAQAATMQVLAADHEVRRQILDIFPNVTLGVEGERPERRALPGRKILADTARASARNGALTAPDIETRSERNLERRQIIDSLLGPTLDITLPVWHQNQAQIAKARYEAAQRRKEFEDLLDAIAQDVQKAVAAAQSAAELVSFFRDQAQPLARENVETARRAYQAGEESIVTLMDAQRTLVSQRTAYVNAQQNCAVALAALRRAVGGTLPPPDPQGAAAPQPVVSEEGNP